MANPDQPGKNRHLAIFRVASYTFCAPAHTITAITDLPPLTRIPKTAPSILGAVNHRGQVVVVVGLRAKLGLPPMPAGGRNQLIIAEIESGLTGFMVDAIEAVRPPAGMSPHPLAAEGAIDIFDAYLVDGDRILLQTTFQKLYDGRDTPPRDKALEADLQQAAAQLLTVKTTGAVPAHNAGAPAPGTAPSADEDAPRARAPEAGPLPARPAPRKTGVAAVPPSSPHPDISPRPERPVRAPEETAQAAARAGAFEPSGRSPWYRYALIAALLLVLTVALGAGVWLMQQQKSLPDGNEQASVSSPQPHKPAAPVPPPPKTTAASESKPAVASTPTDTSPADTATQQAPAKAPEATTEPETPAPPAAASASTKAPREVLRVETEAFTLTVERPEPEAGTAGADPMREKAVAAGTEEIRHVVIRGDTLWDIAAHYLDDPLQYPALARLSQINDPDLIYPDDVIRIVRRSSVSKSTP